MTSQDDLHRLRGETVSVSSHAQFILAELAQRFVPRVHRTVTERVADRVLCRTPRTLRGANRQWGAIKKQLHKAGLSASLQREIAAVSGQLDPRNVAAHAPITIWTVGGDIQINVLEQGPPFKIRGITEQVLRDGCSSAHAARTEIQAIARALDDHDPDVLADSDGMRGLLRGEPLL